MRRSRTPTPTSTATAAVGTDVGTYTYTYGNHPAPVAGQPLTAPALTYTGAALCATTSLDPLPPTTATADAQAAAVAADRAHGVEQAFYGAAGGALALGAVAVWVYRRPSNAEARYINVPTRGGRVTHPAYVDPVKLHSAYNDCTRRLDTYARTLSAGEANPAVGGALTLAAGRIQDHYGTLFPSLAQIGDDPELYLEFAADVRAATSEEPAKHLT